MVYRRMSIMIISATQQWAVESETPQGLVLFGGRSKKRSGRQSWPLPVTNNCGEEASTAAAQKLKPQRGNMTFAGLVRNCPP